MNKVLHSESSFFISPHRLILKTCGTTLNLLGLPRILEIASKQANLPNVYRCFYSRKSFMFPDRQEGPHKDWKNEMEFLDSIFPNGSAYTIGKVNGDHWLLYMTTPNDTNTLSPRMGQLSTPTVYGPADYTIEILMSDLHPDAGQAFYHDSTSSPSDHAQAVSSSVGITKIFPPDLTILDAYTFEPCGYSSNALIQHSSSSTSSSSEGYYTIHVTPEKGWSYASFECNVPLPSSPSEPSTLPDLETLIRRVVAVFRPSRLTLTLFVSSEDNEADEPQGDTEVETAQKAFKAALTTSTAIELYGGTYKRTDKINYEFGGYDLAFASFEMLR
jgi:S-adenosylmethionine decarboxylase